jgi:L-ascorbate metabolism protein UlaG (beta-lactamase superfamily)
MDFEEATDAALDIQPEIVVPMHNQRNPWKSKQFIFTFKFKSEANFIFSVITI